jgi:beta propeller repeat protein
MDSVIIRKKGLSMPKKKDAGQKISAQLPSSFVFLTCVLLVFLAVIFPVSASPNGTETLISTDIYKTLIFPSLYPPAISGDRIAWSTQDIVDDPVSGVSSRYILMTNLTSGDQYVIPSPMNSWNSAPSLDKNTLVWMQDEYLGNIQIVAYDLANDTQLVTILVTPGDYYYDPKNNALPKISGDTIVWQDYSNGNWDIFLYNLTWASGTPPEQIVSGLEDQKYPAIFQDYVVYENWSGTSSTIYLYNISNSTSVHLSTGDDEATPDIDGMNVVWQNRSTTGTKQIILYNITTGETLQIPPDDIPFDRTNPKISGDYIVWEESRTRIPYTDIYLYNLNDGSERLLTPSSVGAKFMPAVDGNRIVWEDSRAMQSGSGNYPDIYLLTLGNPETCPQADFTADHFVDPPHGRVTFTDSSSPGTAPITYRLWNFSDGSAWENDPAQVTTHGHTFSQDGIYSVRLTVGNAKCRNISAVSPGHTIFVNNPPIAEFTATPSEGLAPLAVTCIDRSYGDPTSLQWDFGDGSPTVSGTTVQHTYSDTGKEYMVTLTATNGHGSSIATKSIRTLMGAHTIATTPVNGITVDERFGGQFLTYNSSLLPVFSPHPPASYLISHPPLAYGWQNITFLSSDIPGLQNDSSGNLYTSNLSRVYLTTNDTIATTTSLIPPPIGNNWSVSYRINSTVYPSAGSLQTDTREGASAGDRAVFDDIASRVWPSGTLVRDIAYTATLTKQNIRSDGISVISLSVAEEWVNRSEPSVSAGRDKTNIMGYWYDDAGNKFGAILTKHYVTTVNGVDYYEADIPESAGNISTFALAKLSGSGNVFQLFTISVGSRVIPSTGGSTPVAVHGGGGSGGGSIPIAVQNTQSPEIRPPAPPDAGKTAKIYANNDGVVTQETTLQSTDGLAAVVISEGLVVKDNTGKPLSSITIRAIPKDSLPALPAGSAYAFDGMAYELQPDGATFSPPIAINFTIRQARWEHDYVIKTFDSTTGTWQDVPATYNPDTGVVSAEISHFCYIALFTEVVAPTPTVTMTPASTPLPVVEKLAPSPLSRFLGMIEWITGIVTRNALIAAGIVILLIALLLFGRRIRRDRAE